MLEQPPGIFLFSHLKYNLQETYQNTYIWLGLSPIDTSTPDDLLMLQNYFINYAVERWFDWHTTESGFRWGYWYYRNLIDWLIIQCDPSTGQTWSEKNVSNFPEFSLTASFLLYTKRFIMLNSMLIVRWLDLFPLANLQTPQNKQTNKFRKSSHTLMPNEAELTTE